MMSDAVPPRRVTAQITFALGLLAATAPFSLDAYLPALPQMADEFGVSPSIIQLSLTACLLGLGIGQLFAGPLGDRFGRRLPMIVGAAIYAAASIGCALAPSASILIGFRTLQGLAGAVGLVLARAVVRDIAQGHNATRLYSQMAAISGAAPVLAPVAGALIIEFTGWRGVFYILAGLGIVMIAATQFVIGETHPPELRVSAAPGPVMRAFGGLLADRSFRVYALAIMFTAALLFSYISSAPFVLQEVFGFGEIEFALVFSAVGLGHVVVSLSSGAIVRRHDPARFLRLATWTQLGGVVALLVVLLAKVLIGWESVPILVICLVWAVVPCGAVTPICTALAMARSGTRAGAASAILGLCMFIMGGLVSPISGVGNPAVVMPLLMLGASLASFTAIRFTTRRN